MISINAAIADRISRYTSDPYIIKSKEITSEDKTKEEIIELFKACSEFEIKDDYISFTVKRNKNEIEEQWESYKSVKDYTLRQLKNNYKDDRYTNMMIKYLKHKKLSYVLDELNKKDTP